MAARITGRAPTTIAKDILGQWLVENLPTLGDEAASRERLRGLIPCKLLRPIITNGRDSRGAPHHGRWERDEIVYLRPEAARKLALDESVEILPPQEDGDE